MKWPRIDYSNMRLTEKQLGLANEFKSLGIPAWAYTIEGRFDPDESYCVRKENDGWLVYYSERGNKIHIAQAKDEYFALEILKLFVLNAYGEWQIKKKIP